MLRRSRRTAVPAIALAAVAAPVAAAPAQAVTHDSVEKGVVRLINAKRHREGKRALRLSKHMSVGATRHSAAMVRSNTAAPRLLLVLPGLQYAHTKTVGEVIAYVHAPAAARRAGSTTPGCTRPSTAP